MACKTLHPEQRPFAFLSNHTWNVLLHPYPRLCYTGNRRAGCSRLFSVRENARNSVAYRLGFCYNLYISLCLCAGGENIHRQVDTWEETFFSDFWQKGARQPCGIGLRFHSPGHSCALYLLRGIWNWILHSWWTTVGFDRNMTPCQTRRFFRSGIIPMSSKGSDPSYAKTKMYIVTVWKPHF